MKLLSHAMTARLITLTSLDDAIKYRFDLLDADCDSDTCRPGGRCDPHADDQRMLETYRHRYAAVYADAIAGLDPDAVQAIMQPGDGTQPTARLTAAAILSRLRELAPDGPILTEIAGDPLLLEFDGSAFTEHPMPGN